MKEDLKNIILMGLGAMSISSEKAKDLKDELLKKGNELYESGKIANEELKHTLKDKIKDNVTVVVNNEVTKEDIKKAIKSMSSEDKKEIAELLKEKKTK